MRESTNGTLIEGDEAFALSLIPQKVAFASFQDLKLVSRTRAGGEATLQLAPTPIFTIFADSLASSLSLSLYSPAREVLLWKGFS
jgi:hypothetical protein